MLVHSEKALEETATRTVCDQVSSGVVAALHPRARQGGVHPVAVAGHRDAGDLGGDPHDRPPERLSEKGRIGCRRTMRQEPGDGHFQIVTDARKETAERFHKDELACANCWAGGRESRGQDRVTLGPRTPVPGKWL